MSKLLVTGAAGFIGSYLVDGLLAGGNEVMGVDNLSTGTLGNLAESRDSSRFRFRKLDLRKPIDRGLAQGIETVYHLAADPEVRTGLTNPESQYENNIQATYNVLEFVRKSGIGQLHLFSSSTVYGEPAVQPTPEDYAPLAPISIYGASKLACEIMALGYAQTFGIQTMVSRPANVVGGRVTHGVLLDFIAKLRSNPKVLEVLGDGTQSKSYVLGTDVVRAILAIDRKAKDLGRYELFNIGNRDRTSVTRIAEIVCEEMKLSPQVRLTGGTDGGRAWKGDVKTVLLSTARLEGLGWSPAKGSDDCIRQAVREILAKRR